ncbi:histone-like nucleoid-structuring protein Lsr2 [Rhodococcoides corynebacterioides]|uniref:histone-like nucleoid-structuring protein Lsr2 n=1 Tax=Rhodococcoides corynebacterioides TaxID=53972 RepID=UPI0008304925|nr:Lsr2 family protein [Rhodococcus corynebacterioides]MBY6349329.1 Lsr2 family protein [Rhodococcus corynebacterioides]MBY6362917.1 Lsr2 family protein [Rhodococcus corynebacterioides]
MVKKVTVTLVDDMDDVPADETVSIGLDGTWYEIDLSERNAADLREHMDKWIHHARRVTSRGSSEPGTAPTAGRSRPRGAADRARSAAIREWAKEQGFEISERGRISSEIVRAWERRN